MKKDDAKMTKVLYFVDRLLWGGIQSLLYSIATYIDRNKIQLEVLVLDDGKNYDLEQTLANMGVKVHKLEGIWISNIRSIPPYMKALKKFFEIHHGEYNAIHMNSSPKNAFILYFAKKHQIPVRIAHSHCTSFQNESILSKVSSRFLKMVLKKNATHFFACSEQAAVWMYGKQSYQKGLVTIIKNAIATELFLFNENTRKLLRNQLNMENRVVYGFVGRFSNVKNHKFLIEVFSEIKKIQQNALLLLIGAGELENNIKSQVENLGLTQDIVFLGFRKDRNEWLSAMDCFVMTSIYEGAPVSLVESQAASLMSFAPRETVQDSSKISDYLNFISLQDSPAKWANKIVNTDFLERKDMLEEIKSAGYDAEEAVKQLEEVYSSNGQT